MLNTNATNVSLLQTKSKLYMYTLEETMQKRNNVASVTKILTIPNNWMITFLSVKYLFVVTVVVEIRLKN
jgi:hypothetical protein